MLKPIDETKTHLVHFVDDFKHFILKKNAIDMALGITIGFAFGKVISSLVNDIIMPPIGLILGGVNFSDLKIVLKKAVFNGHGKIIDPEVAINYGKFLQMIIDFTIVAFSAFLIIRVINKIINQKEQKEMDWTEFIKK